MWSQSFIHQGSYPVILKGMADGSIRRVSQSFIHQGSYPVPLICRISLSKGNLVAILYSSRFLPCLKQEPPQLSRFSCCRNPLFIKVLTLSIFPEACRSWQGNSSRNPLFIKVLTLSGSTAARSPARNGRVAILYSSRFLPCHFRF